MKNGAIIHDDKAKALLLNKGLSSVYTLEHASNLPDLQNLFSGIKEGKLTVKEIKLDKIICFPLKLNLDKSGGPGHVSPGPLKEVSCELTFPALNFSKSLLEKLLMDWKLANITPVP